jgi:hypothetical protein
MNERPILFSAPMVRAILAGKKTQTRRVINRARCPFWAGQRLWVRETFCVVDDTGTGGDVWVDYRATPRYSAEHPAGWENAPDDPEALKWKPSIYMPRWASRIILDVQSVRRERVCNITAEDAMREGVEADTSDISTVAAFARLWNTINAKRGYPWESNPWVWVVGFRMIEQCKEEIAT